MSGSCKKALLMPTEAEAICPSCEAAVQVELTEDDAGEWAARGEDRFPVCDECGTVMDAGWIGWSHLDPARHGGKEAA